ncbi:MAG: hypothetical protein N0E48_21620 [Candidatus Thiodiazotropha endolucinida]|nr:hypothetical protein [Candidatus Thiodiazotropha endolucinida]
MAYKPEDYKCEKSIFNYTLVVKPDGTLKLKDKAGNCIKSRGTKRVPPIKKISNTRTITIMEARGSQWVYIKPPGRWYRL